MGRFACRRDQARAGQRRSGYRRNLLPALARQPGTANRRQRRGDAGHPASLSRRVGSCRRPHPARPADRTAAGRFRPLTSSQECSMTPSRDIARLLEIMARLRTPRTGCPWDLEQDFSSIAPYTIEEAYEVADAIARGDLDDLRDELGDLLLQVVYHARMAEEQDAFSFADVVEAITRKMIRRHPHVFADADGRLAPAIKGAWQRIKSEEKAGRGAPAAGALSGVPVALPALTRALKLQEMAGEVGFDWNDARAVL